MTGFGDLNVKISLILAVLILLSNSNFMLSRAEHETSFITSGPNKCHSRLLFRVKFLQILYPNLTRVKKSAIRICEKQKC